MKTIFATLFLSAFLALSIAAQSNRTTEIVPNFKSDGCSMFPDGDYKCCCVAHDLAYFKGGSIRQRWRADNELFKCVRRKKGWWHKIVAPVMWVGVRVGGVPFLPTPFRWGFGRKEYLTQPKSGAGQSSRKQKNPQDECDLKENSVTTKL